MKIIKHTGEFGMRWDILSKIIRDNNLKIGAELGVFKGDTYKTLLNNFQDLKLLGVDLYESQEYNKDIISDGAELYIPGENNNEWDHNRYYNYFL
jgi:hypothetical protein